MASNAFKRFLIVLIAVSATLVGPVSVRAQNTNTTIQDGRININRTFQIGSSNDNATYQTGRVNINRTIQIGGSNRNQTGQFGKTNHNKTRQGNSVRRAAWKRAYHSRVNTRQNRLKRFRDNRDARD